MHITYMYVLLSKDICMSVIRPTRTDLNKDSWVQTETIFILVLLILHKFRVLW